ncbi:MAG: serine hydroxymethyltransferase [Candidatus Caldarchaeum sp.]|nr:serine hydroxymethyltransferase [Candidatus Caldarchaeum sp.]
MQTILKTVYRHDRYRNSCLNLIASENVLSPAVKRALSSDMASRYAFRPEYYSGTAMMHEVWETAEELGKEVFGSDYCSVAPLSGHLALMQTLYVLLGRGGKIAAVDPSNGGYPGFIQNRVPDLFGYDLVILPYSGLQLDLEQSLAVVDGERPDVVVLGASFILYPMPVKELSEAVHSYGGKVVYDGSHVLGLIAGGFFQKPLEEGADVLLGSTHKSFFGPQGGMILTNDEKIARGVEDSTFHKFVDNIHFNRVAALAVALDETKRNGRAYAERVVANASELAVALDKAGLKPFKSSQGYTKSHQVYLPREEKEGSALRDRLESSRILVDIGVRLGTAEVSRRGMGYKQMWKIADMCRRAAEGEKVAGEVLELTRRFREVKYT